MRPDFINSFYSPRTFHTYDATKDEYTELSDEMLIEEMESGKMTAPQFIVESQGKFKLTEQMMEDTCLQKFVKDLFLWAKIGKIALMFPTLKEFKSRQFQKKLRRQTLSHGKMDPVIWGRIVVLAATKINSERSVVSCKMLNTEGVQEFVEMAHGGGAQ